MTEAAQKKRFINRDMLKYLAVVPMAVGHFCGYLADGMLYADMPLWAFVLMNMSLFAPPVFFFFIAEGFHYTKSRTKYALRLLIFALINQVPFCLANSRTLLTADLFLCWNIIMTLFLGLVCLMIYDSKLKLPLRVVLIALVDLLTLIFQSEWMIFGIPIILCFHIFRDKPKQRFIGFAVLVGLMVFISDFVAFTGWLWSLLAAGIQLAVMFAAYYLLTNCYNGEKGKHPVFAKWFFYLFYPAHLWAIYILLAAGIGFAQA